MNKKIGVKFSSWLFFSIFVAKMVIATAPIYINFSDSERVIEVMMQLELEGKAQGSLDVVEKGIVFNNFSLRFNNPFTIANQQLFCLKNARDIIAFFPSVPTPPPNC